jgi:hypothetical protein
LKRQLHQIGCPIERKAELELQPSRMAGSLRCASRSRVCQSGVVGHGIDHFNFPTARASSTWLMTQVDVVFVNPNDSAPLEANEA